MNKESLRAKFFMLAAKEGVSGSTKFGENAIIACWHWYLSYLENLTSMIGHNDGLRADFPDQGDGMIRRGIKAWWEDNKPDGRV